MVLLNLPNPASSKLKRSDNFRDVNANQSGGPASSIRSLLKLAGSTNRLAKLIVLVGTLYYLLQHFGSSSSSQIVGTRTSWSSILPAAVPGFAVSDQAGPLYFDKDRINWSNNPASDLRPRNQFFTPVKSANALRNAHITIFTLTHNPGPRIFITWESIRQQSMQAFKWVIIDDASDDAESLTRLRELSHADARVVRIHPAKGQSGVVDGRNTALDYIKAHPTAYFAFLDDDDEIERTMYEKSMWALESNPTFSLASFYWAKHGEYNFLETRGVHLGKANYYADNFVANAAVIRTADLGACRYDKQFATGGEDWDLWLCFAEEGKWGLTVPEIGYWYYQRPLESRKERWGDNLVGSGLPDLKLRIRKKHKKLAETWPSIQVKPTIALEAINMTLPFDNIVARGKNILVAEPWFFTGGADWGWVRLIEMLAKAGYRVTVVATLYHPKGGLDLVPHTMQWTSDVHSLPSNTRPVDHARYIKYLIQSRQIDTVIFSHSQLLYQLLPTLAEELPHVKWIDYLHIQSYDTWKSGGYPTFSVISQRYLWRTLCASEEVRQWAISRGHQAKRLGVVRLGIDFQSYDQPSPEEKMRAKQKLGIPKSTFVIAFVARIDAQKRPLLLPDIMEILLRQRRPGDPDIVLQVAGSGELSSALDARVTTKNVTNYVKLLGNQENPKALLTAADVFLLPSVWEGPSLSVGEAMASGLPVVTTWAGALPEQMGFPDFVHTHGRPTGACVKTSGNAGDANLYAQAILQLMRDPTLRRQMGDAARQQIAQTFDWRKTLPKVFDEMKLASRPSIAGTPNPNAYYAVQTLLDEMLGDFDFLSAQRSLLLPQRSGRGLQLQERCGETTEDQTNWINGVILAKPQHSEVTIDADALFISARQQCSAWCLFDTTKTNMSGWHFNGGSWTLIDSESHPCAEFWNQKPVDDY